MHSRLKAAPTFLHYGYKLLFYLTEAHLQLILIHYVTGVVGVNWRIIDKPKVYFKVDKFKQLFYANV